MPSALRLVAFTECDLTNLAGQLFCAVQSNKWLGVADPVGREYATSAKAIDTVRRLRTAMSMAKTSWAGAVLYEGVALGCVTVVYGKIMANQYGWLKGPRLQCWLAGRDARPKMLQEPLLPTVLTLTSGVLPALNMPHRPWCALTADNDYASAHIVDPNNAFGGFVAVGAPAEYRRFDPTTRFPRMWQLFALSAPTGD